MKRMFSGLDSHEIIVRTRRILSMQRAIATIVLIAMLFNLIPLQVFANQDEPIIEEITETADKEKIQNYDIDKKDIPIVAEDTSRRTESEKHFRKQDGSYEVVLYDGAVHYQVGDEWFDIDNSLDFDESTNTYKNKDNKFDIKFPKNITNQDIKLKMSDYEVNWQFLGSQSSMASVSTKDKTKSDDIRNLININEEIIYENVMNGIDLSYTLSGTKVKETFIVEKYQEDLTFSFEYTLKNLTLVEIDEGVLLVDENGQTQFSFESLVMNDNESQSSTDIKMTIEQTKNDTYIITIVPSDEWLQHASYPVMIDPTLNSSTTNMSIHDTFISEGLPTTNFNNYPNMIISDYSSSTEFRGLIYFEIPTIVMNKAITYAHLTFEKQVGLDNRQINLYRNFSNFDDDTVTWENWENLLDKLGNKRWMYNPNEVIDYYITNVNTPFMFDITESVKEWQLSGNERVPGFTLALDEWYGSSIKVYQKEYGSGSKTPVISIGYEDPSGLKDYWTYTAQDMGPLGTGYISDYTGNLTWLRHEFSLNNEYLSLGLEMYYSYSTKDENIGYGYGWKTNYNMRVDQDNEGHYYLEKPDGEHIYFSYDDINDIYIAENGSLMELKIRVSDYVITTPNDIIYTFEKNDLGRLKKITNAKTLHNLNVSYTNLIEYKVQQVTDEVGNLIWFAYENGLLDEVSLELYQSYNNYKVIEYKLYEYIDSKLNYVSQNYNYDSDSSFANFNYLYYSFNSNNEFKSASNFSNNYWINYDYYINGKVQHVETSDSGTLISEMDISYIGNQTTYTNYDGNYVKYIFDEYGHTINLLDSFGNTQSFRYASLFTYKTIDNDNQNYSEVLDFNPNYYIVHHLIEESTVIRQQMNPVVNHGFEELNTGWTYGSYGTISRTTDKSLMGDYSLSIENTGTVAYAEQDIYLKTGEYTFIAYIQNDGQGSSSIGSYLSVLNVTSGGLSPKVYANSSWEKVEVTFTINSNRLVTIRLNNTSQSTAYFDNVQLNEGFSESRYNVLSNASFEYISNSWIRSGTDVIYSPISETGILGEILGNQAIKIIGDGSNNKFFYQDISGVYTSGESYIFSGWAKANAVPDKTYQGLYDDDRYFGLYLEIGYLNNEQISETLNVYLPFDTSIETWQYQTYAISLPEAEEILCIKIYGLYRGEGTAYFDNIQFYHDDLTTNYDYNSSGDLTNITSPEGSDITYGYDDNHHVITTSENSLTTNIEYSASNLVEEVEQNNVRVTNEYDYSTNQLKYQFYGYDKDAASQVKYFKTGTTYEFYSQYIHTNKDEFGNIYTYNTDEESSLISDIIDPLNHQTRYTYTDLGQVEYQTFENGNNDMIYHYEYDNYHLLSKITVDDIKYIFDYDDLDRIENIFIDQNITDSVNPELIVSYSYKTKTIDSINYETDLLETKSYSNGDVYTFFYTNQDQLESIYVNNEANPRVFYIYDASNRLAITQDLYNNDIYYYSYDLAGRLEAITDQSGNVIKYGYDNNGNISNYIYEISNIESKVDYYYDDQTGLYDYTEYKVDDITYKKEFNYDDDSLKRLRELVYKVDENSILTITNIYDDNNVDISMGNATLRIYSIIYTFDDNDDIFTYVYDYDDNQNISGINIYDVNDDIIFSYEYVYDVFGRLEQENIRNYDATIDTYAIDNCTVYYDYDNIGNITGIIRRAYGEEKYIYDYTTVPQENPYTPYLENYGYYNLDVMYNNGYFYDDVYEMNLNETPTFSFLFYDLDNQQLIYENQLYIYYNLNDINTSVAGYYLMDVEASYPGYYNLYFSIIIKVGNPTEEIIVEVNPESGVGYTYDPTDEMQILRFQIISDNTITNSNITYDDIGNPTTITNFVYNETVYHHAILDWEGRRLVGINVYSSTGTTNLVTTITYQYNDQGARIGKHDTLGDDYEYILDGDIVLAEIKNGVNYIYYTFDVDGKPLSMTYGGSEFFYIYDLQGNVIGLMDDNGSLVVSYKYDAWGNIIDSTNSLLAHANPYRYRGYRYDEETGLYYLQSRYYNPVIARFINMDDVSFLTTDNPTGINLYAYCANNPVMYIDPSGEFFLTAMLIGFGVGTILGAGFEVVNQINSNGYDVSQWDWEQIGLSALGGGVAGAISAIGLSSYSLGAYVISMGTGGFGSVLGGWISGSVTDVNSAMLAFGIGAIAGGLAKGIGHLRFNIKASSMLKATGKARSLAINNFLKTNNFSPVNIGHSSFGGWSRNLFKSATNKSVIDIVSAVTIRSSIVYSAITSSLISGWY